MSSLEQKNEVRCGAFDESRDTVNDRERYICKIR